ncbi:MAG TPA: ATP-binding cassette domain-containing protein [Actinomycetota bacterium]|nr:ATP-binding cassette domain-containing protein [Actinomycetota bacterium]
MRPALPSVNGDGRLEVSKLTVEYSSGGYVVRPISGLDLTVEPGKLVLLLGASGSGKTTLLSVLAGILTPTAGSVRLGDVEVTGLRGDALTDYRRHRVGIVFQSFNLIPSLSAAENVQLPLRAAGVHGRDARHRADVLLEEVGLTDRARHRPAELSGGQQQRVAVARALAMDPPLVLADEPTAHLDYIQVDGVIRLLREVADQGRTVVVATHDERMVPLSDGVLSLTRKAAGRTRAPQTVELSPGDILFRQGDQGDLIYVVERGVIEIFRERDDGTEETLTWVHPGNYFGELGPMFGLPRSAGARASKPSTLTGYTVRDFRARFRPGSIADILSHED